MSFGRHDPGECPICGVAHSSCGAVGPIAVVQLPARDATRASSALPLGTSAPPAGEGAAHDPASLLGDGTDGRPFSTGTYRGTRGRRAR